MRLLPIAAAALSAAALQAAATPAGAPITAASTGPAALAAPATGVALPAPVRRFTLDGHYRDSLGGDPLTPNGGTFAQGGYRFEPGQGLILDGLPADHYTLDAVLRFEPNTGWGKLIDFRDRTSDAGLYRVGSALAFWGPLHQGGAAAVPSHTLLRLVVTRSEAGLFTAWANGQVALQFHDAGGAARFSAPGGQAWLFQDDGWIENAAGWVGEIRVWDRALTADQVAALGPPTAPVPEPASAALLALGGAVLLGWRRRRMSRR